MAQARIQSYEGRWEDLLTKSREFEGKRVKITVVADAAADPIPNYFDASPEDRARALDEIANMNAGVPVLPPDAYNRDSLYDESLA